MFTPNGRDGLRDSLIAAAQADERIGGAAPAESALVDREDQAAPLRAHREARS
ncbi:hypothetical protein [Amycolatopsis viridis]|uniref:Uncharacterized protein n=1 Tax=Amycolatopsis viridis TaxID=185678 RepID=A0ABX0SQN4_9PSEU|nr:hypothetical protein [Amycolatopsis viridis]NIH77969.1 hypothetical protein [Amycolatopsis viridis]